MTRPRGALVAAALALVLAGCRASLEGKKLGKLIDPQGIKQEQEADKKKREAEQGQSGISYYLIEPVFTIDVKDRHDGKPAEPVYDIKAGFSADESQHYSVRLKSGTISNDLLTLKLRPDGTLANFGSKSESRLPEVVASLGNLAASGLRAAALGVPATAALSEEEGAEGALRNGLCTQKLIDAQKYSTTLCVYQRLVRHRPACEVPQASPCPGVVSTIPAPPSDAQQLQPTALQIARDTAHILIVDNERKLWTELSKPMHDELEDNVLAASRDLRWLRELDARVADRLGALPLHEALAASDVGPLELETIQRNLQAILDRLVAQIAAKPVDDTVQELSTRLSRVAEVAAVASRIDVDSVIAGLIKGVEGKISDRFEKGELATEATAGEAEKASLVDHATITKLETIRAALAKAKPASAAEEIARDLASKKDDAERQFARYVAGTISRTEFDTALKRYTDAATRLLEQDDRLRSSLLSAQHEPLAIFASRSIPTSPAPQDKEANAYRTYREELDRLASAISARLGTFLDPKKPADPLPRGTQVSRTLSDVVACTIDHRTRLFENDRRLLRLAEIWMKYGGKEAVVFRARSDAAGLSTKGLLDCDGSPFGASENLPRSASVTTATLEPAYRLRSGMHIRRLTSANLADGATIAGVLVQVPTPYDVFAVLLDPKRERVVKATTLSLPSQDEFLDLDFKGRLWRSQELTLSFHDNGGLNEYKLDSKEEVSEGTQKLADSTKAVTDTLLEIEKAKQKPSAQDPVAAANDELKLQLINAMLKANLEAVQRGDEPPFDVDDLLGN